MENKKKSLFNQMKPYIKGFQLPFVLAVVGAIISSSITVWGPRQLKKITDIITKGLTGNIDVAAVSRIALFLAILYVIGALINYFQSYTLATIIQNFSKRLRTAIAEKINRLPLRYFDSHSQGDTLSRVTNDVDLASQSLTQSLATVVSSIILLFAVLVTMFWTNAILSVVTSYNAVEQSQEQFRELNSALHDSIWKSQFISGIMMPLMIFIGNFGYVAVVIVGATLALDGYVTMGTIVAFMIYVRTFSQPLSQIAQGITTLQSAGAAMNRVFEFLAEPEMEDDGHKPQQLQTVKGNVTFKDVFFGYTPDKTIIHDFSATAKAGQKIAIVGPTGAGKTTIVNLLMKFYEINHGSISIDGVDIKNMKRSEVHDAFSMVLQDTWLFEGSIRDNLIYNQKGITDEQVIAAAKAVGVHHYITTLPDGYDTVLDDRLTLSVGQKQLLTIARALLKDAPLLILDEATSSVDTRTEELIQKAMDKLMEGRTSFVIAHRLSTIKNADLILVMRDGNIIEQGNHDELMAQGGFYAGLYNSQFVEEDEEAS
ncbi:ABC transporter ATP-binding protein [Streptococcus massiliensis]|uniref:ABC-type multidrug/protein/lipid transport system, ATPase component n=1 Tax=Streptococcus massiliensis TaxID=313439 RepID=A0A380KZD6_9STRE|nr:ABC transporter ATP-binding protein [Streptococcus massiliensis]SUN76659.1 ABC-type multidrug/protein/lipid transport system, ATPase component [Streptococcus massiliensis]